MHQFSTQWVTQFGIESEIWSLETRDECKRTSLEDFKHLLTYWCNIVKSKQFPMHLKDSFQTIPLSKHSQKGVKILVLKLPFLSGSLPKVSCFSGQNFSKTLLFTTGYLISVSNKISPRISKLSRKIRQKIHHKNCTIGTKEHQVTPKQKRKEKSLHFGKSNLDS